MELEFNKYQTPITEELKQQYPEEVIEQLYDCLTNIPFIQNLVSPNRKYAKDCERDENGRIIVDLTNPHIVEDMDYFRQPALHFLKHGCYTFLKPNSNPHSEYRKFWDEEIKRCREGYIREKDGEWVTGYLYWFLNYNPMMVNFIIEGTKRAERKESFPFFFEGIYWRFHYLEKARNNGKHAIELAKRGAHPYFEKVYTPSGWKSWGDIQIGSELYGTNGAITKVIDIPYDKIAPYYKITLRDGREVYASDDHKWVVKVHNHKNIETYTTKELLNIYKRKHKISYRNPNGVEYTSQILKNNGVDVEYKQTLVDPYTFGLLLGDGSFRHPACYFTQDPSDMKDIKPYILYPVHKWSDTYSYGIHIPNWKKILKSYGLDNAKSEDRFIPEEYKYNSREVRLAVLRGLMDTDGCAQKGVAPYIGTSSPKLAKDIMEISRSLGYNCSCIMRRAGYKKNGIYKECLPNYAITIYGGKELFNLPRKKEKVNYKCSRAEGTIITNIEYIGETQCKCVTVDSEDSCYLIGDYITTHNCAKSYSLSAIMTRNLILGKSSDPKDRRIITSLIAYQKEYLRDDKDGTLSKFKPSLNFIRSNTPFPRLMLKNSPNEMSWQMGYKDELGIEKGSLNTVLGLSAKDDTDKCRGKRSDFLIEEMGTFGGLLAFYDTIRKGVEDGNYAFNLIYLVGTANESESDFSSAKKLLQSPDGYNIYSLNNMWDKPNQGSKKFGFFFPSYINRAGCYNKDGVSDVIKALLEILMARYNAKYNSADPKSVLRVIAEDPITPAEAIIKVKAAYFPVTQLNERLLQLESDSNILNQVYVGDLVLRNGQIEFTPTNDEPIRKYGVANTTQGAVEIFEMPEKDRNGNIPNTRYIVGLDPVDNDQADSTSLSSTFVFDLFTDRIVAEFTGRKQFADDNYEITRKLCLFYNAKLLAESNKKGWYAYFAKMNCTHLLAETPEYLREKQLVKYSAFGSNKYGVNATAAINNYANDLIRNWLLKPVTVTIKDENGDETIQEIPILYTIKNKALLEELVAFNPVLNFDRIRSLGMVMLYREEKVILYQGDMSRTKEEISDSEYLGNDEFFTKNFDLRGTFQ